MWFRPLFDMSVQRLLKTVGIPWTKKGAPLSPWFNPNHCKWWLSCFADVVGAATHCGLTARPSNAAARSYTSLHVHWLIRQFTADDSAKQRRRHFRHRAEPDARTLHRVLQSMQRTAEPTIDKLPSAQPKRRWQNHAAPLQLSSYDNRLL